MNDCDIEFRDRLAIAEVFISCVDNAGTAPAVAAGNSDVLMNEGGGGEGDDE